ncbi:MAG TPA: hypothetical protein PLF78_15075, partial [Caulobacter sp.]|nr:hypothetical protein [Caulobacter sp.]
MGRFAARLPANLNAGAKRPHIRNKAGRHVGDAAAWRRYAGRAKETGMTDIRTLPVLPLRDIVVFP